MNASHFASWKHLKHSARLCLFAGMLLPLQVVALSPPPSAEFSSSIAVIPAVAAPGVPRVIRVSGLWNDSCTPVGASILDSPGAVTPILSLRMQEPQTLVACAQVLTLFSVDVSYTPTQRGTQRVLAQRADGRFVAEGRLVTGTTDQPRAEHDLSGVWFDPLTAGSGLALFHSQTASDVLVGSWYLFDGTGTARWYTLQNGRWASSTLLFADLVESRAAAGGCGTLAACPRPATSSTTALSVSIEVFGVSTLIISAFPVPSAALTTSLPPLFASSLSRIRF